MKTNNPIITNGFILATLMNTSVLGFSRFFTNPTIAEFDPVVMSNFGLMMIVVWGLAYLSIAKSYHTAKWLVAVFALEKLIYSLVWINWILNNSLAPVFEKDLMAGLFYSTYGLNDLVFFAFFSFVFLSLHKDKAK